MHNFSVKIFLKRIFLWILMLFILFSLFKYVEYKIFLTEEKIKKMEAKKLTPAQINYQNQLKIISEQEKAQKILDQIKEEAKKKNIDSEILKKYSKTDFLDENYVPSSLTSIDKNYINKNTNNFQFSGNALPFLNKLISAAREDDLSLQVSSAYRSYKTQAALKANYIKIYGTTVADNFSANPGFSEHQLGTAADFTIPPIGTTLSGFEKTQEYQWLLKNAYKYGFVISYPKENTFYKFEPWHWRFVGIKLANKLHDENKYFSDEDQEVIDSYLGNIFDQE